jgi:alpha-ribazole phosphatase
MYLTVLRHAQPVIEPGVCYGQLDIDADSDATLSAAQQFCQLEWPEGLILRTSPSKRCQQLAIEVQKIRPDFMIELDNRLMELNFGKWEGLAWEAIAKEEIDAWVEDFSNYRTGGGESTQMILTRVKSALDDYMQSGESEVWITHNGVLRSLICIQEGRIDISKATDWPVTKLPFGQSYLLDLKSIAKDTKSG